MSLQRRLMVYLLVCAPLVWAAAVWMSVNRSRHEVNELYDTELIRLARQIQATMLPSLPLQGGANLPPLPQAGQADSGEGDVRDLAVAVWDREGQIVLADREGGSLPFRAHAVGFVDDVVDGQPWRIYYLQSTSGQWLVAVGQGAYERDEVVFALVASQVLPWLLVLPLLLLAMAWAVRRALAPIHALTGDLHTRDGGDLAPLPDARAPAELKPLLGAMNSLFARIDSLLTRERRFTADAAHELRTPLAVLRAQWDVVKRSTSDQERRLAEQQMDAGLTRMDRLVTQMLALSRAETATAELLSTEIDWPPIVEQVMSDCLELADRRRIELACEWPASNRPPLPLIGNTHLMTVLLRNLLDNAACYAPPGSTVLLRMGSTQMEVENAGGPLSAEQLAGLGQRFHRPPGQEEGGSGLGVSIAQRIAALHGLEIVYDAGAHGDAVRATVRFARVTSP
ncbi:MAG: sensor histidine kinase N-terminal domain-containing protein [Hydrogenophaga sp.]|uniref:sensor histidine kinase N-terminal domain-containing protein n=1 Tax=Hydrogenophaga sp. TaxID=1904254 RepID=UPI002619D5CA|nr:sensor histidine kinase N-terminal domain-containing protein [Hydrogenophaga sp.]MCW5668316.1 sensor histidine kinase N-terminal domain-containing protein [Hydrogenophaga sp.]